MLWTVVDTRLDFSSTFSGGTIPGQKMAGDGIVLPKYRGMLGTVATIAREEDLASLWKGIVPGLYRQCLFGGLRIGLYEPGSMLLLGALMSFGFIYLRRNQSIRSKGSVNSSQPNTERTDLEFLINELREYKDIESWFDPNISGLYSIHVQESVQIACSSWRQSTRAGGPIDRYRGDEARNSDVHQ